MTWYFSEQVFSMPSLRDLPSDSPPSYNGDHFVNQSNYLFPHSIEYHDSISDRYNASTFPYLSPGSEAFGYCQQQYSSAASNQHQAYRDNPFVWIGTNNFYPTPSYEQRYLEDSYNLPQRQSYRRHHGPDRNGKANTRKRRAPTVAQRRAANIRERRRMYNLNEAFDCLRQRIPTFAYEKRLSRIETLRLAISYISFMAGIVNGEDPSTLRVNTYDPPMCQAASMTQSCFRHEDSIPASQNCENDDYDEDRDDLDEDGEDVSDNEDDEEDGEGNGDDNNVEEDCVLDANGDLQKSL